MIVSILFITLSVALIVYLSAVAIRDEIKANKFKERMNEVLQDKD